MTGIPEKKQFTAPWGLIAIFIGFIVAGIYIVKAMMAEDGPRRKNATVMVTLMKPPPLPEMKVKPIEQPKEIQKQDDIINPEPQNAQPQNPDTDNTPAGDELGLDAEGVAGSDAFGLVWKKGGRSLLSGGGGGSLLSQFAGYSQIVQTEIRKKVMKRLETDGGIPKGKQQAVVRITINSDGGVVKYRIVGSSGNHRMDEAVKQALGSITISEPPPDGMPRTMDIKITSQG